MQPNLRDISLSQKHVSIAPGVSVLGILKHLNYKPWYAIAEFVDNAIQSHQALQNECTTPPPQLRVDIDIDTNSPPRISIRDNAGGISIEDFPRAFRPATVPPDRSGLAEFGMGMKSAACWFAPKWQVRTTAPGDTVVRTISFDIENIVADDITELEIDEQQISRESHFTEVSLTELFNVPAGRTLGKIKEHLTDIYRAYVREGQLDLRFRGEPLVYVEPAILEAPFYKAPDEAPRTWRKDINFDLGSGQNVSGFAAIRSEGSTSRAGFSLFRRGRVIEGSADEGYRPQFIFGATNGYRYQRVFGELHLDGFDVSHTKDGFRWDENEQAFLELLKEHLDSSDLPLLRQAEGYRVRAPRPALKNSAQAAVNDTGSALAATLPTVLPALETAPPVATAETEPTKQSQLATETIELTFKGQKWEVEIELTDDESESQWLIVSDSKNVPNNTRKIDIRVSMVHPFMVRFAQEPSGDTNGFLRLAAGLAIAEILATSSGIRSAGTVRRNLNELISSALSAP